ncbi:PD40 domain-containing protein [bacterium]|nr:PD40 domain-containing protein [bacterium]
MKKLHFIITTLILSIFVVLTGCSSGSEDKYTCSPEKLDGTCPSDSVCNAGECISKDVACSTQAVLGYCEAGYHCENGTCMEDPFPCSSTHPTGICENGFKCEEGSCVEKTADISDYKIGVIGQKIDTTSRPHQLLDEFHFYLMDSNGRNVKQLTTEANKCINEFSCFISQDMRYFLYYVQNNDNSVGLKIANISDDYIVDFAGAAYITLKISGEPHFINGTSEMIYVDSSSIPWVTKYNMADRTSSQLVKFSTIVQDQDGNDVEVAIDGDILLSPDGKKLVYSIDKGYGSGEGLPIEIYLLNLDSKLTNKIYEYGRVNLSGIGLKYAGISDNNEKLAFISTADNQHRLHYVSLDGSDLIPVASQDPETSPLGVYLGPDYNSCDSIVGTQICDVTSQLFFSNDGRKIYFSGKTGKWTELSPKVNFYHFTFSTNSLFKITAESNFENPNSLPYKFEDASFGSVVFNPSVNYVAYVLPEAGNIKNNEVSYLNYNSTDILMEEKVLTKSSDIRELKIWFLKRDE